MWPESLQNGKYKITSEVHASEGKVALRVVEMCHHEGATVMSGGTPEIR